MLFSKSMLIMYVLLSTPSCVVVIINFKNSKSRDGSYGTFIDGSRWSCKDCAHGKFVIYCNVQILNRNHLGRSGALQVKQYMAKVYAARFTYAVDDSMVVFMQRLFVVVFCK